MEFLQNLPNNGCCKNTAETDDDVYYHPYVAFHDTKPDRYCRVSKLNHFERSIVLRKKLKTMHRQKKDKKNNIEIKQRNRCRKRKRTEMQSDASCNSNNKRIKRLRSSSSNDRDRSLKQIKIIEDFCVDAIDSEEEEKPNVSLFDSLNKLPTDTNMIETLKQVFDEHYDSL